MQYNSLVITKQPTTRLVVSINLNLAERLKKTIPARKRSEFVEQAIAEYLIADEKKDWWQNVQNFQQQYSKKIDHIQEGAVSWLKKDRQSH